MLFGLDFDLDCGLDIDLGLDLELGFDQAQGSKSGSIAKNLKYAMDKQLR